MDEPQASKQTNSKRNREDRAQRTGTGKKQALSRVLERDGEDERQEEQNLQVSCSPVTALVLASDSSIAPRCIICASWFTLHVQSGASGVGGARACAHSAQHVRTGTAQFELTTNE